MITREDYLNALELIDQYHQQSNLAEVVNDSALGKTPINEWKHINKCSRRLHNILYLKPIGLGLGEDKLIDGWKYIENISRQVFLMQRNAGIRSWEEFVALRGY